METYRLCDAIKEALGAKRFAGAVGRTLQTVYAWCRDPNDPEVDGDRNLLDWLEAVIDALAARPEGRPVLVDLRSWVVAAIDRALGAGHGGALTPDRFLDRVGAATKEFGDVIAGCQRAALECRDTRRRLRAEVMEAIAELERLAGELEGQDPPAVVRAG